LKPPPAFAGLAFAGLASLALRAFNSGDSDAGLAAGSAAGFDTEAFFASPAVRAFFCAGCFTLAAGRGLFLAPLPGFGAGFAGAGAGAGAGVAGTAGAASATAGAVAPPPPPANMREK